jgi:hypothetical protein
MTVQLHYTAPYLYRKNFGSHSLGGWVGPTTGLDILDKRKVCPSYQDSNLGPPSPQPPDYLNKAQAIK